MSVVFVVGIVLSSGLPAVAQADQEWVGYQGGPGHLGSVDDGPQPPYSRVWSLSVPLGGPDRQFGVSAPVVSGDVAIVVAPDEVLGIDLATGRQDWTVDRDLGPPVPAAVASVGEGQAVVYTEGFGEGPPNPDASASPTPSVAPTGDGVETDGQPFNSHLAAFDLETRDPLFKPVPLDAVSRTGVTVSDDVAYVGVAGGRVYAVDLTDGSVAWTVELNRPLTSALAVAGDTVVVGLQSTASSRLPTVVGLDTADGERAWSVDDEAAAAIVSTAAATDETAFVAFSGAQESSVDAIDITSGERAWRSRFPRLFDPSAFAPPVVTSDAVFATDALGVTYAMDPATGSVDWTFALNESVFRAAPISVGGHVVVGTVDGELVALDAASGDLVSRLDDGGPVRALAVAGDLILVVRGGRDAGVMAYRHDPQGALIRETSPTTPDAGSLALNLVVAGVAVAGITLVMGRVLVGRMGPAFPDDGDDLEGRDPDDDPDDEDEDPGGDDEDPDGEGDRS
jgi:outer membrane protein assembly factor BamB